MISNKIPSKIGWKAFRWLFLFQATLLLVVGSYLRIFVEKKLVGQAPEFTSLFLTDYTSILVFIFWSLLLVTSVFSVFFIWNFFTPLSFLLKKSRSLRKGKTLGTGDQGLEESWGEWYQMDLALNKILRDLNRGKADVARERSELEALVMAANDAILSIDNNFDIRYYNAPMALLFDQSDEGGWGKGVKEVFRNKDLVLAFEDCITEQKTHKVNISKHISVDSSVRHYEVLISPLLDEKKKKNLGAVAIFHDMTEYRKVEKVRVDFVANASHELKTPVTSIQGYLDVVKTKMDSDDQGLKSAFTVIENNLERLNHLVTDLLDLSRIETSENIQKELLGTEEITGNVLEELQSHWQSKSHKIDLKVLTPHVLANRDYLEQVLINLIENACKYSPEKSEIYISWDEFENRTRLRIKDNGPGIESYHQGRLFERFYRVRDEVSVQGTGLGLSIVKNAMTKQKGYVDVKSVPGFGTEFICYFPVK